MADLTYTNVLATAQQNDIKRQEYWDNRILGMIKLESENFVFSRIGRPVEIPKNQGTTKFSMRRYNSLPYRGTDELLTEGNPNTPLQVEAQRVDVEIDQFGAWIEVTDNVKDIHMDDVKRIYQPELARHAAEVRERNTISKFTDASTYFVGGVATAGAQLTDADILTMKDLRKVALFMKVHNRQGHPAFGGKPVTIVHSAVMNDLLDDEDLKERILLPGTENVPIKIGTLASYQFYGMYVSETLIAETSTVTPQTGDPFTVYTSYMLGKDPFVIASLGGGSVEWHMTGYAAEKTDPLGQRATFGYKMWTGAAIVDPIAITKIYSRSNYDVSGLVTINANDGVDVFGDTASQVEPEAE
jgi:N4-gp56 family major capsid protein